MSAYDSRTCRHCSWLNACSFVVVDAERCARSSGVSSSKGATLQSKVGHRQRAKTSNDMHNALACCVRRALVSVRLLVREHAPRQLPLSIFRQAPGPALCCSLHLQADTSGLKCLACSLHHLGNAELTSWQVLLSKEDLMLYSPKLASSG